MPKNNYLEELRKANLDMSKLIKSREAQEDWYSEYRAEFGLKSDTYISQQSLLDFLGEHYMIYRKKE